MLIVVYSVLLQNSFRNLHVFEICMILYYTAQPEQFQKAIVH